MAKAVYVGLQWTVRMSGWQIRPTVLLYYYQLCCDSYCPGIWWINPRWSIQCPHFFASSAMVLCFRLHGTKSKT